MVLLYGVRVWVLRTRPGSFERGDKTNPYQTSVWNRVPWEVLKEALWEVAECGSAMDLAMDRDE